MASSSAPPNLITETPSSDRYFSSAAAIASVSACVYPNAFVMSMRTRSPLRVTVQVVAMDMRPSVPMSEGATRLAYAEGSQATQVSSIRLAQALTTSSGLSDPNGLRRLLSRKPRTRLRVWEEPFLASAEPKIGRREAHGVLGAERGFRTHRAQLVEKPAISGSV